MSQKQTQAMLQAIQIIWDELPGLTGELWSQFEAALVNLLEEFERSPEQESVIRARILALFGQAEPALKQLVACMNAESGRGEHCTKGLAARSTPSALTRLLNAIVTRYTDIACPRQVFIDTPRVAVVVRLTLHKPEHSAAEESVKVRQDLPVQVRLEAPGFEHLNQPEQEMVVLPDADSPPVVFDLRPIEIGPKHLIFDFFQAGNPAGTASVPVEVTADPVSVEVGTSLVQALRIQPNALAPDLMLYIGYERFQQQPALRFTLMRAGEVGRTFSAVALEDDPAGHAGRLYQHLTGLGAGEDPTAALIIPEEDRLPKPLRKIPRQDIDRRVRNLGEDLWDRLIPQDLKAVYAKERDAWRDRTLVIVSDEPYIPWELVWPFGEDWEDENPLCITTRMTRWLRRDAQGNGHEAAPATLRLRSLACLAPPDSGLAAAQTEREFLKRVVSEHGLRDLSPWPPTWSAVADLLEEGEYDWLHAAAHGNFYPPAPDSDSAVWLQDQRALQPESFVGRRILAHLKQQRPGFFLNACHTARQEWTLTRMGGWPDRLVSKGAGFFLAPMWTVSDDPALTFARSLYGGLLSGQTVAESVRQARLEARTPGDPTWLAYSVYAHPNARLEVGP